MRVIVYSPECVICASDHRHIELHFEKKKVRKKDWLQKSNGLLG